MRVGFSGYFWQFPETGSGQYSRRLFEALGELGTQLNFTLVRLGPPERPRLVGNLGKVWFEQVHLWRLARRAEVNLVHVPYFGPPWLKFRPLVVTVHDLLMLVLPGYRGSLAFRLYIWAARRALGRADRVIADSRWTRNDILKLTDVPANRVEVVPLGVDPDFGAGLTPERVGAVRRRYGLDRPYILYLGGFDRRKQVDRLVRLFREVPEPWILAVGGRLPRPGPIFPDILGAVRGARVEDRVRFLGPIPDEDRPALYAGADLFVYPSVYEGFGLPPLEAMACGTPVVCSNRTSLPEVVGEAAMLVDPEDDESLLGGILKLLRDADLRAELRARGLERARQFTWRRTAEATYWVYLRALGSTKSGGAVTSTP
ncbi:MAG: glycosyltransferase family 1 protein [Chloroflexota bacterium]